MLSRPRLLASALGCVLAGLLACAALTPGAKLGIEAAVAADGGA